MLRKTIAILALVGLLAALPADGQPRPNPKPKSSDSWVNGLEHDGHVLTVDLPGAEHIKNIGSYRDGAGMCVMSSIEMAARWAGLEQLRGLRNWCAKESGGAYPSKVDRQLAAFFKEKGIKPIPYLQYEGRSPERLMELIYKTGRMACITYSYSPRYGGRIAHMVCSPMYRGKYAVVLDNNFIGEDKYEWMSKEELVNRMKGGGGAWVFVWLVPGPPPVPHNKG